METKSNKRPSEADDVLDLEDQKNPIDQTIYVDKESYPSKDVLARLDLQCKMQNTASTPPTYHTRCKDLGLAVNFPVLNAL